MFQIRSQATSMLLLLCEALGGGLRLVEHRRERSRVEVALVEQALGGLDDGGHDPRLRHDPAHRADRALARTLRDLADLELELRGAGERVAASVHGRRARVRGLAGERDEVSLDAERPEHDSERQLERLEHRPLLDVQLEVGGRALELAARLERAVELDPVGADRVGKRDPVRVAAFPQLVLVGHRTGRRRRAEERAAKTRALLVGPVDEAHGRRGLAVLGKTTDDLDPGHDVQGPVEPAAVRDRVDVPADQHRALARPAQRPPLVPGLVDLVLERQPAELVAEPRARPLPGLRPGDPLRAVRVAGQLAQLLQLGNRSAR